MRRAISFNEMRAHALRIYSLKDILNTLRVTSFKVFIPVKRVGFLSRLRLVSLMDGGRKY